DRRDAGRGEGERRDEQPGRSLSQAVREGVGMSGHRVAAITRRLLHQFRRDRRTLALLFVAPIVILSLLGYLIRGSASKPGVGIANEDQGPAGGVIAASLQSSSKISATTINASDGEGKLKDGSLVAYIVFPADF